MDEKNKLESGFQIRNMILLENNFSRINNVSFGEGVQNNIDVNVEVNVQGNVISVIENITVKQLFQDTEQVNIQVKMVGVFEKTGDSKIIDLENFGHINGAAIIFPYIREHITNLSLKAGLGAIILPPINFTANKNKNG